MGRAGRVSLGGGLRGLAAFAMTYAVANLVVLASYEREVFTDAWWWGMLLAGTPAAGVLLAGAAWWLAQLHVRWAVESRGEAERAWATRQARRASWVVGLGGWALALATGAYLHDQLPIVEAGPLHLRPSASFQMDRLSRRPTVDVHTNAHGFRDTAWGERRPGEYRVVLVGDSIVFGSGIRDQAQTLTAALREALRGSSAERAASSEQAAAGAGHYVVHNLALNGLNTHQEVDLVEQLGPEVDPDLVVLVHNEQNDLMPPLPYYRGTLVVALFPMAFVAYINALDRFMRDHPLSSRPGRLGALQRDMQRLADLADARGFDVLTVYLNGACDYDLAPARLPKRRFFVPAWVGGWTPDILFPNDFHPTPEGVRYMAGRLAKLVRRARREAATWRAEATPAPVEEWRAHCRAEPATGTRGGAQEGAPAAADEDAPPPGASGQEAGPRHQPPRGAPGHAEGDAARAGAHPATPRPVLTARGAQRLERMARDAVSSAASRVHDCEVAGVTGRPTHAVVALRCGEEEGHLLVRPPRAPGDAGDAGAAAQGAATPAGPLDPKPTLRVEDQGEGCAACRDAVAGALRWDPRGATVFRQAAVSPAPSSETGPSSRGAETGHGAPQEGRP